MDPQILNRIRTQPNMSWIRNTAGNIKLNFVNNSVAVPDQHLDPDLSDPYVFEPS
jgi:hypothetical protein